MGSGGGKKSPQPKNKSRKTKSPGGKARDPKDPVVLLVVEVDTDSSSQNRLISEPLIAGV